MFAGPVKVTAEAELTSWQAGEVLAFEEVRGVAVGAVAAGKRLVLGRLSLITILHVVALAAQSLR